MNVSGHQRKRRRGNAEISNYEHPVNKVPCSASEQNLLHLAGFINEVYLCTYFLKASTVISEKCSLGHHALEEQNIEKLKVKPEKCLRLPSWQCKGLILQWDYVILSREPVS